MKGQIGIFWPFLLVAVIITAILLRSKLSMVKLKIHKKFLSFPFPDLAMFVLIVLFWEKTILLSLGIVVLIRVNLVLCKVLISQIISTLAKKELIFFEPPRGSCVYVYKGEDVKDIWPNISGHKMSAEDHNGKRWIVKEKDEKKRRHSFFYGTSPATTWLHNLLWDKIGVRYMSILIGSIYIRKFKIGRKRLIDTDVLTERIQDSPNAEVKVNKLLFLSFRPVMKEVELAGDNSKIIILVLPTWQLVIPMLPVPYWGGDFYRLLDSVVEAGLEDFFASHRVAVTHDENGKTEFHHDIYDPAQYKNKKYNCDDEEEYKKKYYAVPLTYAHWLKLKKSTGSALEKHLMAFNCTKKYYEVLQKFCEEGSEREREEKEKILAQIDFLTQDIYKEEEKKSPLEDKSQENLKKLEEKGLGEGTIAGVGYAMINSKLVAWEAHKDTEQLAQALRQRQTEYYRAQGVREESYGKRDFTMETRKGYAKGIEMSLDAIIAKGVAPNVAADILGIALRTENIRDSKVLTYVEGGSKSSVLIPSSTSKTE